MRNKTKLITGYNVGIVGSEGFLGQSFAYALDPKNKLFLNDISVEPDSIKYFSKEQLIEFCDMILVSVPTPYSEYGYVPDILDDVICELNYFAEYRSERMPVCIKSAVLPSHVTELIARNKNLSIVISPEYLSGRDAIRDMINCKILIMGGEDDACDLFIDLFQNHSVVSKELRVGKLTAQEASLLKYMQNSFLAMKCAWLSEFKQFYDKMAGNLTGFNEVIRQFQFDDRVGQYPYKIPFEGCLGYCSGCLEKDVPAICDESFDRGAELEIMKFVHNLNESKFRKGYHPYCSTRPNEVIR